MNVKKLLFNNIISGGGDTPTPTATLITDKLYTHLDGNDIDGRKWNDRMGHYNFASDASLGLTTTAYNLTCEKMLSKYKKAYCNSFKFSAFPFTLEFTVKISAANSHAILCSCTALNKFKICCNGDSHLGMYSTNASPNEVTNLIPVSSITDNTLHVIDYVFVSNSKLLVYLDGVLTAEHISTVFSNNMLSQSGFQLGATDDDGSVFTGHLYSFRFYKKELSEYEIRCNCLYEATQGRSSVSSDAEQSYFLEKWN